MRWIACLWIVGLAGAFAYVAKTGSIGLYARPSHAAPAARPAPTRSTVAESATRIFAGGIVEGVHRELALTFDVSGRVKAVHVQEGDLVKAGEVLAELDTDEAELLVSQAETQLKIALAERDQLIVESIRLARETGSKPSLSREEKIIAEGKVALAETAVRRERLLLDKLRLRAPIDATVLRALAEPGELIRPQGDHDLFILVNRNSTRVRAYVEELDAMHVRTGQHAAVTAAGSPGREYPGIVRTCSPHVRPKSHRHLKPGERLDVRVREVVIDLENGADLLIGLPVEVFIARESDLKPRSNQ